MIKYNSEYFEIERFDDPSLQSSLIKEELLYRGYKLYEDDYEGDYENGSNNVQYFWINRKLSKWEEKDLKLVPDNIVLEMIYK